MPASVYCLFAQEVVVRDRAWSSAAKAGPALGPYHAACPPSWRATLESASSMRKASDHRCAHQSRLAYGVSIKSQRALCCAYGSAESVEAYYLRKPVEQRRMACRLDAWDGVPRLQDVVDAQFKIMGQSEGLSGHKRMSGTSSTRCRGCAKSTTFAGRRLLLDIIRRDHARKPCGALRQLRRASAADLDGQRSGSMAFLRPTASGSARAMAWAHLIDILLTAADNEKISPQR